MLNWRHKIVMVGLMICLPIISNAQLTLTAGGGINGGALMDFSKKPDYNTTYTYRFGDTYFLYADIKLDTTYSIRLQAQYDYLKVDFTEELDRDDASYFKDLDIRLEFISLKMLYPLKVYERNKHKVVIFFGLTGAYTLSSRTVGNGWRYVNKDITDSSGNTYTVPVLRHWEIVSGSPEYYSKFNVGVDLGFEYAYSFNEHLELVLQNANCFYFSGFFAGYTPIYTPYLASNINLGLRYVFKPRIVN